MSQHRQAFKKAFPYTIPVLTGYLFIGIAFGVMYAEKGYSFVWAILMSLLVYAGSGQYLAVNFSCRVFLFTSHFFDIYGECQTCVLWNLSFGKI